MSSDRWQQVETLYHAARERAPEERPQFLADACRDSSIRREVESLLGHAGEGILHRGLGPAVAGLVAHDERGALRGRILGRNVLGELIGAGGMGEVYRAHDAKLGRDVAIKILPASLARHPDRLARFEREARVLASLNHPHIAAIYGFEESAELHGLVLELVEGQTLAQRLDAGPLNVPDALQYASQIADGLKAAHDKGVVHRDLKPANIKITSDGVVKVLDFGIAKAAADPVDETIADPAATREGVVLGTAPYMSPEQARGQTVDRRADTWAFGCVLYEMLTGRPAFPGASTIDVLAGVVGREPALESLPAATPRAIRTLLAKCLTKDVALRENDFAVIKTIVDGARHSAPATTKSTTWPAVFAATIAIAALAVWAWTRPSSSPGAASGGVRETAEAFNSAVLATLQPARLTATNGFDGFLSFSHDGKTIAYSSDRSGAMEIYVEGLAPGSTPLALTSNSRQNVEPQWSPDGQFIAFHEMAGGGLWIVPSRGGTARQLTTFGSHPSWSEDGRQIVFQSRSMSELNPTATGNLASTIWIADVNGRTEPHAVTVAGEPRGDHVAPRWTAGRIMFATGGPQGSTIWAIDGGKGKPFEVFSHARTSAEFAITPGGRALLFRPGGVGAIWWVALSADGRAIGEPQPTGLPIGGSSVQSLTLSSDGRRLGWTTFEQSNNIVALGISPAGEPARVEPAPLTETGGARFGQPSTSADGRVIMIGSRPGSNSSLYLLAPPAPLRQLTSDPPGHGAPRWIAGDREISYITDHGDGPGMWAFTIATGRERVLFPFAALPKLPAGGQAVLTGPALAGALAENLSGFAFAVTQNRVTNIWVAALANEKPTGALVQRTFEREGGTYPLWSPDGKWIAYQCQDGANTQLCVTGASSGDRIQLTNDAGQSWTGGWSLDSEKILIAARRNAVWNVMWVSRTTGAVHPVTRFTQPRFYVRYPRWDAANKRVLFEHSEAIGRIWSVELP